MAKLKESSFSKFSIHRKIIVVFLLVLVLASVVFSITSLMANATWAIWHFFPLIYFFSLFIVTYHLHNLKKILRKAFKILTVIFYSGMILYFIIFSVFCFLIFGYEPNDIPENPDIIIILGCQVYGDTPSNMLKSRLDAAVEALNKYPEIVCIVSGGQGPDEIVPESDTMKLYLVSRGIDENRIYKESESSSSFKNLSYSKNVIEKNNLKCENIIIITSEFHVPRASMIAKRVFPDANIYAFKSNSEYDLFGAGIIREFFAFVKSFIFDRVENT